jgi:hypothetical protein
VDNQRLLNEPSMAKNCNDHDEYMAKRREELEKIKIQQKNRMSQSVNVEVLERIRLERADKELKRADKEVELVDKQLQVLRMRSSQNLSAVEEAKVPARQNAAPPASHDNATEVASRLKSDPPASHVEEGKVEARQNALPPANHVEEGKMDEIDDVDDNASNPSSSSSVVLVDRPKPAASQVETATRRQAQAHVEPEAVTTTEGRSSRFPGAFAPIDVEDDDDSAASYFHSSGTRRTSKPSTAAVPLSTTMPRLVTKTQTSGLIAGRQTGTPLVAAVASAIHGTTGQRPALVAAAASAIHGTTGQRPALVAAAAPAIHGTTGQRPALVAAAASAIHGTTGQRPALVAAAASAIHGTTGQRPALVAAAASAIHGTTGQRPALVAAVASSDRDRQRAALLAAVYAASATGQFPQAGPRVIDRLTKPRLKGWMQWLSEKQPWKAHFHIHNISKIALVYQLRMYYENNPDGLVPPASAY